MDFWSSSSMTSWDWFISSLFYFLDLGPVCSSFAFYFRLMATKQSRTSLIKKTATRIKATAFSRVFVIVYNDIWFSKNSKSTSSHVYFAISVSLLISKIFINSEYEHILYPHSANSMGLSLYSMLTLTRPVPVLRSSNIIELANGG